MNVSPDLATAERELAAARRSFNTAHRALDTTLSRLGAREGAADHLIYYADEYGIHHTFSVLSNTPATLDLDDVLSERALSDVQAQLIAAYHATHAQDRAMANVENLKRQSNSTHHKAILIGSRAYVFNATNDTLHDTDTGVTVKANARVVETESGGPSQHREPERDR